MHLLVVFFTKMSANNFNKYKLDLHTHSIISHDGGLTAAQYTRLIETNILDYIAITDHNETRFARIMHEKLGDKIIIGEEVTTTAGEIIGLFLSKTIPKGLTPEETIREIRAQGGLVCIPHPFETFRKGLQGEVLERIAKQIDIIETFNARGRWRGKNDLAVAFAEKHNIPATASSDSHCIKGMGSSYSIVRGVPMPKRLKKLLRKADLHKQHAPLYTLLCPAFNKVKNKVVV